MILVPAQCPTCKKLQPHKTLGEQKDNNGRKYQTMVCTICNTSTQVYSGENGEEFQQNYSLSDGTDRETNMSNVDKNQIEIEIMCKITDESESKGLLNELRIYGFDQSLVSVNLPIVTYKGKIMGSFDECLNKCRELNKNWRVQRVIIDKIR